MELGSWGSLMGERQQMEVATNEVSSRYSVQALALTMGMAYPVALAPVRSMGSIPVPGLP